MVDFLTNIASSFILGLLTPLSAVCVLPLYPGFLAYLGSQIKENTTKKITLMFGIAVSFGVILFMGLIGLLFTTILQVSLTGVIGIISPIAFFLLGLFSILLIIDFDFRRFLPSVHSPLSKNPILSALLFGFFFGAVVVPCNPLFIAALFTKATAIMDFVSNMVSFISFGIGLSTPLLVFSIISAAKTKEVIGFMGRHSRIINLVSGVIMLGVSVYYLIYVFRILG